LEILDGEGPVNEELDKVTEADWASCVHHTVKLQEDDYVKEPEHDGILDQLSSTYKTVRQ
jgi:hypothetical protein